MHSKYHMWDTNQSSYYLFGWSLKILWIILENLTSAKKIDLKYIMAKEMMKKMFNFLVSTMAADALALLGTRKLQA